MKENSIFRSCPSLHPFIFLPEYFWALDEEISDKHHADPDAVRAEALGALVVYGIMDAEPDPGMPLEAVNYFERCRPLVDRSRRRYLERCRMEGEAIAARERERSRRGGVFDAGREMRPSFTGGEAEQPLPWDVPAAEGRGGPVSAPQAGEAAEGRYRDLPAGTTRSRLALYLYPEAASSAAASKRLSAAILADRGLFMGLLRLGWSPRRRTFTKAQKELVIDALGVK